MLRRMLISCIFAVACIALTANNIVVAEKRDIISGGDNISGTDSLVIGPEYFDGQQGEIIQRSEYGHYRIPMLKKWSMIWENEEIRWYDNPEVTISLVGELELLPDITSLIIRGDIDMGLVFWLVNYNAQGSYLDSYIIGEDEWAESAGLTTSVIRIYPRPHIRQVLILWESREDREVEIMPDGIFRLTKSVHSTIEF